MNQNDYKEAARNAVDALPKESDSPKNLVEQIKATIADNPLDANAGVPNLKGNVVDNVDDKKEADEAQKRIDADLQKAEDLKEKNKASVESREANLPNVDTDFEEEAELDEDDKAYLADLLKEEKQEEEKPKEGKKTFEQELEPYKAKASAYEEIENDPLAKAFLDFRKKGGTDINEFVKEVGIVDVSKMSNEELWEQDLKKLNLTPEQMEEEMAHFKELRPAQQAREVLSIKNELLQKRDEKLNAFSQNVNKQQQQQDAIVNKAIEVGTRELGETLSQMEGKKYKGMLFTPEMAKEVRQYASDHTIPKFEDGQFAGYDIKESVRVAILVKYEQQLLKAQHQLGKTLGTDKALKLRQRPNRVDTSTVMAPLTKQDSKEAADNVGNKLWERRLGK